MLYIKRTISIILISIISLSLAAQKRISYYDLFTIIKSGDNDKAYTLLVTVQKQDPDFANTYFQLGIIAKKWAFEFNPFTDYKYSKQFCYNTKLYFNLAKLKIANDKKKNLEYYSNAGIKFEGAKLSFDDVRNYINEQVQEVNEYEDNITKIIEYFNCSSDHYNECVKIYMQINSDFNKINNIYLTEDAEFLANLKLLEQHFDSTIYYFNNYKSALKDYPLKGYNQKFKLNDIITYRLDGLTNSNFLNNQIDLWNYKKWVQNVLKVRKENISNNRTNIDELDEKMRNQINQLDIETYSDVYKPFKLDDRFVYKIEKFDNNSLLIKLFKFNEAKINYLISYRKRINDPTNISKFNLQTSALFSYNLLSQKEIADSLNVFLSSSIELTEINKYKKFYTGNYSGIDGLKDYSRKQTDYFNDKQKKVFQNLKVKLYSELYNKSDDSLFYKGKRIHLKKEFPSISEKGAGQYFVSDYKENKKGNYCFSGFKNGNKSKTKGIFGFTDKLENIKFLKETASDTANIFNLITETFQGGYFTIETFMGKGITNILKRYSDKGVQELKKELPYHKIPRFLSYDDINNTIIIVFSGKNLDETKENDELIIYHINLDNELKSFTIKMPAKTYVFDIIKKDNRIFVFSNYVYYMNSGGTKEWSSAGKSAFDTNLLLTIVSPEGMIEKQIAYKNKNAFFGSKAIKLNSNTINILGFVSPFKNTDFGNLSKAKPYYLLIDSDAQEIYSSWHD